MPVWVCAHMHRSDIGTVREAHRPSTPPGPSAEDLAVLKYEAGELPPVRFTARTDSFTTVQRFREIVKATDEGPVRVCDQSVGPYFFITFPLFFSCVEFLFDGHLW